MLMENITSKIKISLLQKFSHHLPVSYALFHILLILSRRMALKHQNVGDLYMFPDACSYAYTCPTYYA